MNQEPLNRVYYELQPIFQSSQWWLDVLVWAGVLALLAYTLWMVTRDSRELPKPIRWTLAALRLLVFFCVVVYLVNPGQRSESSLITDSRLAVLVDTSLSMGLPADISAAAGKTTRMAKVIDWVSSETRLQELRRQHELSIYRFDETSSPTPVVTLPKLTPVIAGSSESGKGPVQAATATLAIATWLAVVASLVLAAAWLSSRLRSTGQRSSPLLAGAVLSLAVGLILCGLTDLVRPEADLQTGLLFRAGTSEPAAASSINEVAQQAPLPPEETIQWDQELRPRGTSSKIGAAIQYIINNERGGPLAGIAIFTDGQSNSGLPTATAIAAAKNANVPLYPVGVGSIETLKNIEVAYLEAPPRVLPGDEFQLKAVLKSFGYQGRQVRVTVNSVAAGENASDELEQLDGEQTVDLTTDDGVPLPIEFDLQAEEEGKRRYRVEVELLEKDSQPQDNTSDLVVEVIQRKTRVMLIAGGPSREFRFLRNQLFRDKNVQSDVWLQSATEGADQESNLLLTEFPSDPEKLFEYDCLIAFDPDWRMLTVDQVELLERWVAEKAGGLVLVAGPVNTPEWTRRPRGDEAIDVIRDLYPVVFFNQGSARLKLGRFGGGKAFPLAFTRPGRAARFLWLGESAATSVDTWSQFDGVFGYYAVNEAKPGADVLANFSDDSTAINGEYPIYLASQFYGAGRVLFQASGEMWRVRRVDVDYFQDYYDQLVRWAAQGRLLRDSSRGVLLTDRDRCWVGDRVRVQAILKDAQDQPYLAETVSVSLVLPDDSTEIIQLRPADAATRPGTFDGVVAVDQQGEFRIVLPVPDSADADTLQKTFQASIPDLEKLKPQRNDASLQAMADQTGGQYYVGVDEFAADPSDPRSPVQTIVPQDQETFLTGTLNRFFQQKLMIWLLIWLTFACCAIWTLRRSHKLS